MDPKLFKRLARAYITGTDVSNVELSDTTKNLANTIYSIEKIEKKYAISSSDTVGSALVKTTQASATATPAPKPAEALTEAQVIDKIKNYSIDAKRIDGTSIPADAFSRDIKKLSDGRFSSTFTVLDAKKIDPRLVSVRPIITYFDKQ